MLIYDRSQTEAQEEIVGKCRCKECGKEVELIKRYGLHWRRFYYKCCFIEEVKKEIDDVFQIGDRVRSYHKPFFNPLDLATYYEGIVVAKEKELINYKITFIVDKVVCKGKVLPSDTWRYGTKYRLSCDCVGLELLTPQMKIFTQN